MAIKATGGGPATQPKLTAVEEWLLAALGIACVDGVTDALDVFGSSSVLPVKQSVVSVSFIEPHHSDAHSFAPPNDGCDTHSLAKPIDGCDAHSLAPPNDGQSFTPPNDENGNDNPPQQKKRKIAQNAFIREAYTAN